jgi:hypothetical protein
MLFKVFIRAMAEPDEIKELKKAKKRRRRRRRKSILKAMKDRGNNVRSKKENASPFKKDTRKINRALCSLQTTNGVLDNYASNQRSKGNLKPLVDKRLFKKKNSKFLKYTFKTQ